MVFRQVFEVMIVLIPAGKKGPVYEVEWSPDSNEFCVVYGCIHCVLTIANKAFK